ncbi:hypothetical protein NUU61_009756 [Penicillium alfredii]|uniref:Peptidase S8/S53 domain-containing protein n=1 Tax=Penicillium alfredii TaxID=1506179 RepID=A0A9W9EGP6_9EURO|nr:uncharacterized protein NUU61_009756 [Penicillium alfredii]KAJ5081492.1 hypothetical protein NUU61_009756 [Penicillium alfredii]
MKYQKWLLAIIGLTASTIHALPSTRRGSYPDPNAPQHLEKYDFDDFEDVDSADLVKRDLTTQYNAELPQGSISRPRTAPPFHAPYTYVFDESAGDGTFVYVIDTGFSTITPAYQKLVHEPQWIIPTFTPNNWDNLKNDPTDHGTCVGSLVAAYSYGIAKRTTLVIVKVSDKLDQKGDIRNFLEGLDLTIEDIQRKLQRDPKLKGKIFINLSRGRFRAAMHRLNAMTMIFAAAGNAVSRAPEPQNRQLQSYPQLWHNELPNMMIVGMATPAGHRSAGSYFPLQEVYGPFPMASGKTTWGTSLAAPQAAGLAAYIAGLPEKPKGFPDPLEDFDGYVDAMKTQLRLDSWIRPESKKGNPKPEAVPLISNQLQNHCKGRALDLCRCAII